MNRKILRGLLLAAVVILAFEGCNLLPVSVEGRVDAFLADVNSMDRGGIYLNFHPTLTVDYDDIRNEIYPDWDALFPVLDIPFNISGLNTANPLNVTCSIESPGFGSVPIVFLMAQDGMDWMIQELDYNGANVIQ